VLLFLLKLSFSPGRTGGFQLLRNNEAQRVGKTTLCFFVFASRKAFADNLRPKAGRR
jgi:hypothetical protein